MHEGQPNPTPEGPPPGEQPPAPNPEAPLQPGEGHYTPSAPEPPSQSQENPQPSGSTDPKEHINKLRADVTDALKKEGDKTREQAATHHEEVGDRQDRLIGAVSDLSGEVRNANIVTLRSMAGVEAVAQNVADLTAALTGQRSAPTRPLVTEVPGGLGSSKSAMRNITYEPHPAAPKIKQHLGYRHDNIQETLSGDDAKKHLKHVAKRGPIRRYFSAAPGGAKIAPASLERANQAQSIIERDTKKKGDGMPYRRALRNIARIEAGFRLEKISRLAPDKRTEEKLRRNLVWAVHSGRKHVYGLPAWVFGETPILSKIPGTKHFAEARDRSKRELKMLRDVRTRYKASYGLTEKKRNAARENLKHPNEWI